MNPIDWNFFDLAKELGVPIRSIEDAPSSPGYYMLFSEEGLFIYVGKATDLKSVIAAHLRDDEPNERIRILTKWAIWQPTRTVEEAEESEAALFDTWVRETGQHPICNKIRPPRSTIIDQDYLRSKIKTLFHKFGKLGEQHSE